MSFHSWRSADADDGDYQVCKICGQTSYNPTAECPNEEAIRALKESLENTLKGIMGQPADPEAMRATVRRVIIDTLSDLCAPPSFVRGIDHILDVLAVGWCGMPEGFDARALLRKVPTPVLERMTRGCEGLEDGPMGWIFLELMERRGQLGEGGWVFERKDASHAVVKFNLKEPVKFITATFEIES